MQLIELSLSQVRRSILKVIPAEQGSYFNKSLLILGTGCAPSLGLFEAKYICV